MEKFSIALILFTVFWGFIGIGLPFLIPKGPHRRWLCFYLHQWKPLFGPQLTSANAGVLRILWGTDF
ncbi:unnamed protein product [Rotaria socialis]|uniref:Uncharacterized protein n=1 Tax=Rotaria socialis TaxID=392032 RepID=A0A817Z0G1_9BILA|nr:unnamed protein product [Rotaria socialis]CAF3188058.1 unnamed protein product [Rotaria socialis]CAF3364816.1 unnamed protein product [Rotaria socialis]CAF3385443.1 unnamed protein product [Rotaria socialis]CAF3520029.1 unnamed protein product [Rotaria socialis]